METSEESRGLLKGSTGTPLGHPTPVAAIFDLFPNAFPFLSPCEGTPTNDTSLLGQVLFFDSFHGSRVGGSDGESIAFILRSESR